MPGVVKPALIASPLLLFLALGSLPHVACELQCQKFSSSDRILIGRDSGNVVELHIRHNIQGEVEIRDGSPGEELIKLEIDKTAAAQSLLENVITNQTVIDIGYGTVYMLQVDYISHSTRIVTIIISAVIAAVIFLALLSVLLWWYCKVERQRYRSSPARHIQGLGPVDPVLPDGEERYVESNRACELRHNTGGNCMPPPPPPRRANGSYTPQSELSPAKTAVGTGSPRGVSRTTVVTLSLMTVLSVVYAGCSIEPQVHIIVFIPPVIKLHAVKLFFNKIHDNTVVTKQWSFKNATELAVFDLVDASPTDKPPCSADKLCPNAHKQDLAGCDAATEQCICHRGYELSKGTCSDIDECSTYQHSCPSTATCRNTVGSYVCQCGYGYYGETRRCKACSTGCPAGTYESSPCGTRGDRACSACEECKGSMYEVRPCGTTSDRQCMHAAHPLLITGDETTPTFLEGLKVDASDNVFLENLHSTRNLETTYYVTDMTQASDFYWVRESGLQVNIGILNVNMIPEYHDVDHESDNDFMLQVPGETEDKIKFRKIIRNQCRNPIPDHYSLTLEISRDRITAAHPYICDSKDGGKAKCPPDHQDGEMFLHRTLNEPCQKMGTFPEPLDPAGNSYVCTQNSGLLNEIFNQTFTTEREIRFPPRRCRSSSSRCEQCLKQHNHCTQSQDPFEQQCCQIDCYTLRDCKIAQSEHCASAPIECAMGDAYRYTIQPMFENIKNEFQCHIKRKQPELLYQMFYYIMLPDRKFETPKVYKNVYAHDIDYQSQGSFVADYLTVEHNTGLNLNDDFILIGRDVPASSNLNYTIHSLKKDDDFRKRKSPIHKMSHNVYVAPVQVTTPFAYSTRNWVKGNYCEKDVNNFKSVQKLYNHDSQNVNVMLENVGAPFRYFLKSQDNPPYLRFLAPGNTSVLPWYFRDNGPVLHTNESLQASLELVGSGRIWVITIKGRMSGCPGYLGVTINNRLELEELFRYDTLIFCPAEFNLTFKVPNWGQDPDKTFDIHLEDAKKSYDIYLTHMLFEQDRVETGPEPARQLEAPPSNLAIPGMIMAVAGVVLMMLIIVYSYLDCTKARLLYASHNINIYHTTSGKSPDSYCISARNLSQGQVAFIVLYTILRFLYSLIFTFTVFFALLMLLLKADFLQLSHLSQYQSQKVNSSRKLVQRVSDFGQDELLRQARLVTDMQGACSYYIEELFEALQQQMDNVTNSQHKNVLYNDHSSISYLLHNHVGHRMGRYRASQDNFTTYYQANVDNILSPKMITYSKYLKALYSNQWFQFPQLLYNNSSEFPNKLNQPLVFKSNLSGTEVDFAVFMEIEETELISLLLTQFWQRYMIDSPVLPQLPLPRTDRSASITCDLPLLDSTDNITTQSPQSQLDSGRFFAPHLPDRSSNKSPEDKAAQLQEEYRFLSEIDSTINKDVVIFSVQEFVDNIDTHVLKILFLVLDIMIILYRISRTYMTATTLCRGFEDTVSYKSVRAHAGNCDVKESELQNLRNQAKHMPGMEGEQTYLRGSEMDKLDTMDSSVTDYTSATLESQRSMLPPPPAPIHAQHMHRQKANHMHPMPGGVLRSNDIGVVKNANHLPPEPSPVQQKLLNCRARIGRALQSTLIPKLLIACVLLLLFYMTLTLVNTIFSVQSLEDLQGFSTFLAGLDIQVNQTNSYLQQQASHFNDITMKIYENQMRSELLHLESMLEYFNSEQKRLVTNYLSEACAVKKGILGNRQCDIQVTPMQLTIPMLPCNFVPIQPQLYRGFRQLAFEAQLGNDFMPFLVSAKNIATKTGYAVIAVAAVMFLIHIMGMTLFHYLKTRHKFPVHRVFVTSSLPVGGSTPQAPPAGKESDSESDDTESGFKSFSTRVRMSPEKNYSKTETLLSTEFKYSETKV